MANQNTIADLDITAANNLNFQGQSMQGSSPVSTIDSMFQKLSALLATFYDELGGTGTVGGTANAITLTTSATAPFGSLANGNIVAFKNTAGPNTGATTINVDALGAKVIRLQGDTALAGGELALNGVYLLRYDTAYNSAAGAWIVLNPENNGNVAREKLLADRTYYVRTDGSDSNTGLANTAGGAFLTVQKGIDVAYGKLDLGGFTVTIAVAAGTYAGQISASVPQTGSGTIQLVGDTTTPSNVVLNTTGTTLTMQGFCALSMGGFKIVSSVHGIVLQGPSQLTLSGKMEYGAITTFGIYVLKLGRLQVTADYTISGGGNTHIYGDQGGVIGVQGRTVTLTGTPAFSTAFIVANGAQIIANGNTYSGAATGPRYSATLNGVINTSGGGATYFPGNSVGSTATGGQYA